MTTVSIFGREVEVDSCDQHHLDSLGISSGASTPTESEMTPKKKAEIRDAPTVEEKISYEVITETSKGVRRSVLKVNGKLGISQFMEVARKEKKKKTVACVYCERLVNDKVDGEGKILRYIVKSNGDGDSVVCPKGRYKNIDNYNYHDVVADGGLTKRVVN